MNKTMKRLGAGAVVGALALAGIAVTGSAAFAAPVKVTTNSVFELLDAAGNPITSGSTTAKSIYGIHIDSICPAPYAADSVALFALYRSDHLTATDGTFIGSPGATTDIGSDGSLGSNGLKATDTQILLTAANGGGGPFISLQSLKAGADDNGNTLTPGAYELRYTCYTTAGGINSPTGDDAPYFAQPITIAGTTWSVPVAKIATTNALSGTVDSATKKATFTATVTKASGSATPSGTVDVKNGATTLCTITLPVTTCTTAALADGNYSAIATYNGDAAFNGSTSGAYAFNVGAAGTATGTITVNIPAQGNNGLTLTGTPSATINATHSATGNRFTGNADTAAVTVTDERQVGAPTWNLAGTLTNLAKGTDTIPSTDLGWTPKVVGTPGAANYGSAAAVLPTNQAGTGFNGSKPLAHGDVPANSAATTTQVNANLVLDTAGNKPAGAYVGTLTITLTAP